MSASISFQKINNKKVFRAGRAARRRYTCDTNWRITLCLYYLSYR